MFLLFQTQNEILNLGTTARVLFKKKVRKNNN